jgi:rare lipoprotein A
MRFFNIFIYLLLTTCFQGCSQQDREISCQTCTPCHSRFSKKAFNRPYNIRGVTYTPQIHYEYEEEARASYYGGTDVFHGRKTSTGEVFDMNDLSAAHKTLPLPSVVRVTNLENGRVLILKVNDRGPFIDGRIIDVSRKAAKLLGFYAQGTALVRVETLVPESLALADNYMKKNEVGIRIQSSLSEQHSFDLFKKQDKNIPWALAEEDEKIWIDVSFGAISPSQLKNLKKYGGSLKKVKQGLRVGPFGTSDHARSILKKLKIHGISGVHIVVE